MKTALHPIPDSKSKIWTIKLTVTEENSDLRIVFLAIDKNDRFRQRTRRSQQSCQLFHKSLTWLQQQQCQIITKILAKENKHGVTHSHNDFMATIQLSIALYGDSVDEPEDNSSVLSLIRMCWLPSARACR